MGDACCYQVGTVGAAYFAEQGILDIPNIINDEKNPTCVDGGTNNLYPRLAGCQFLHLGSGYTQQRSPSAQQTRHIRFWSYSRPKHAITKMGAYLMIMSKCYC